jgi:alkylhydroperoxidase/carboxymuconolactone decarboxylase family protein YurZ
MPDNQNPLEVFQQEAPEIAAAFDGLIQAIRSSKGLDEKTRQS